MILISHADDFGLAPAISQGIRRAAELERLSEVSVVVTGHLDQTPRESWQLPPRVTVGLHFNLTEGRPRSKPGQIPHLVNRAGEFYPWPVLLARLAIGRIPSEEIEIELAAQIDAFAQLFGVPPTHLDSHHHIHLAPKIWPVIDKILTVRTMTVRAASRLQFGPTFDPRPYLINQALEQLNRSPKRTPVALMDVRWLPRPTLSAAVATAKPDGNYELIWHLAGGHQFAWRAKQQQLIEAESTWQFLSDQPNITLGTYADVAGIGDLWATKR